MTIILLLPIRSVLFHILQYRSPVIVRHITPKPIIQLLTKLPRTIETKLNLFEFYKDLYTDLGLYEQYKFQIHKYLFDVASDKD